MTGAPPWPCRAITAIGFVCGLLLTLAATDAAAQTFATNGRPTLRFPAGEIEFRARLESTLLTSSERQGIDQTDLGWQTRRIEVEGTLFKKLEFEISHEFGESVESEKNE